MVVYLEQYHAKNIDRGESTHINFRLVCEHCTTHYGCTLDLFVREHRQNCLSCYLSHVHLITAVAFRLSNKLQKMAQAIIRHTN